MNNLQLDCFSAFKNGVTFKYFLPVFILLSVFSTLFSFNTLSIPVAIAHTEQQFGNISLGVGWSTEPALVDELNDVLVIVNRQDTSSADASESSITPIRNALSQMNVLIKYGGITKELNFVPSEKTAGEYVSNIIPTRIGSYSVIFNGTIDGQDVSAEIPIEDAEGKQKLDFPTTENSSSSASGATGVRSYSGDTMIGSDLRAILSEFDNNMRTNSENMSVLLNSSLQLQGSLDEQGGYLDTLYMISVTSIGISIGAILISAFTLRKRSLKQ